MEIDLVTTAEASSFGGGWGRLMDKNILKKNQ
jgi:hypothetical protein